MQVRPEQEADKTVVREIVAAEFDTGAEADLVEALREQADPVVSLVAEEDGAVVGYAMFTPVTVEGDAGAKLMGLAPLAVTPAHQGKGFGSALVREGFERCRQLGYGAVVVLGHPEYYERFGFEPASRYGLKSEYAVPDEAFMALELEPGALADRSGTVRFHAAFKDL
ncbi:MAG: N-acetyltransferase [Gammaproteobacteria bacterium]|nr:N-acetyltransferase [Gammaproteobacteria bacterium]